VVSLAATVTRKQVVAAKTIASFSVEALVDKGPTTICRSRPNRLWIAPFEDWLFYFRIEKPMDSSVAENDEDDQRKNRRPTQPGR